MTLIISLFYFARGDFFGYLRGKGKFDESTSVSFHFFDCVIRCPVAVIVRYCFTSLIVKKREKETLKNASGYSFLIQQYNSTLLTPKHLGIFGYVFFCYVKIER